MTDANVIQTEPKRNRSRFVTVLGWFCCLSGGLAVPAQLIQLGNVGEVVARPALHKAAIEAMGGSQMHPITRLQIENLGLMAGLQLLAALLMLGVGVGLVRRESWTLKAGAVLLSLGALRQASSLVVSLSAQPVRAPGMSAEQALAFAPMLAGLYSVSLAWLVFLVWKFRRPSVQEEFQE